MRIVPTVLIIVVATAVCLCAAGAAVAPTASRVVSERNGEIVIEVAPRPDHVSPLPKERFFVAVPPGARVSAERVGGGFQSRPIRPEEASLFEPSPDTGTYRMPQGLFPPEPVVVSGPVTYRNTRVVAVDCYLRQLDSQKQQAHDWSGYRVVVRYPAAAETRPRESVDALLADLVVNRDEFPTPAVSSTRRAPSFDVSEPMGFSKSRDWVKIEIDRRGMYVITGAELSQIPQVTLSQITDPSSFRMFTGSGLDQERDLNDPDASWRVGNWMKETAIYVDYGGDGTFDPLDRDRIIFYGQDAEGWRDHFDATAPDTVYHVHGRATKNYYYLTWDSTLPGEPLRMQDIPAAPAAGPDRTTFRQRIYLEKDRVSKFHFGGDFWLWLETGSDTTISRSGTWVLDSQVYVHDLVPGVPQEFRTLALARYDPYRGAAGNMGHHVVYETEDENENTYIIGHYRWDGVRGDDSYEDGKPVYISGSFLTEGRNEVKLTLPRDENPTDWSQFAWLSMTYERRLLLRGDNGLGFSSPDTSGVVNFRVRGLPASGPVHVFDVTDRYHVARLANVELADDGGGTRRARFSASIDGDRDYYWAVADAALLPVAASEMQYIDATDLRSRAASPRMVIVTDPMLSFQTAAERLAIFRRNNLPYFGSGAVEVVTTSEIYDNFSGGLVDPFAIRNYIKFLYDNFTDGGDPVLTFVLLLGDATMDFKNRASTAVDRVPTFLFDPPPQIDFETFVTDEWYAHMDASDQSPGFGAGDLAIGRLPAASASEAGVLVDKVIAYESTAPMGNWRSQVILVADDEGAPECEIKFTYQSERIAREFLPDYVDVQKVYLVDFIAISGMKPASREMLLELWNDGATAINYVGHGGSEVLANEHVFLDDDVAKLNNGSMLPIFMAFSCTVGDFGNHLGKCLSEDLLVRSEGGAVGTLTSSSLAYIHQNEVLNYAVIEEMLPREPGDEVALGEAIMTAKLNAMLGACPPPDTVLCSGADDQENNNWKYNLLSDPALRVAAPQQEIHLIPEGPDSLVAGIRKTVRGAVYRNGSVDTGFNGSVTVRIHEPDVFKRTRCRQPYYLRGGTIYRGSTDVNNGEFEIDFRVPRYALPGPQAYLTAYAEDGRSDAIASLDSLLTLVLPTMADSILLVPIDGPPRVKFGFKSGLNVVKPGESLRAIVRDQDGINILNTTPEGRHVLLIDDSPVPLDVTKFFDFDYGGADTSGVLTYPLPDLPVGDHRAIFRVSDSFAQTTLDTLEFSVTDPLDYFAEVVLNYPNPFATSTQFLIHLSNRASIRLDIFTVSGKRIRRLEEVQEGGERWILWDGKDATGHEIANGTYLYVATVEFLGVDRTPLIMRGKLTKIQ